MTPLFIFNKVNIYQAQDNHGNTLVVAKIIKASNDDHQRPKLCRLQVVYKLRLGQTAALLLPSSDTGCQ